MLILKRLWISLKGRPKLAYIRAVFSWSILIGEEDITLPITQPDRRVWNERESLKESGRPANSDEIGALIKTGGAELRSLEISGDIRRSAEDGTRTEVPVELAVELCSAEVDPGAHLMIPGVIRGRVSNLKSVINARLREVINIDTNRAES